MLCKTKLLLIFSALLCAKYCAILSTNLKYIVIAGNFTLNGVSASIAHYDPVLEMLVCLIINLFALLVLSSNFL